MPDSGAFAAEAAHGELEVAQTALGAAHLHDRVNQMVRAIVCHLQLVIQREKLFFDCIYHGRLFGLAQVSVKELALLIDGSLALHSIHPVLLPSTAQEITSRQIGGVGNL